MILSFLSQKNKNIVIKYLNNSGIGTKNLPDAIRWHCAHFWKHALDQKYKKFFFD